MAFLRTLGSVVTVQLYLLLCCVDDGQVSSFALAEGLALGPIPCGSRDEVAAAVEEMPVHGADDRGLCCRFDHLRS